MRQTHRLWGYQHAFFTDSVGLRNNLPSDVVEAASLDVFKCQLAKLHVLKNKPGPADSCHYTQYAMFYSKTLYLSEEKVGWA